MFCKYLNIDSGTIYLRFLIKLMLKKIMKFIKKKKAALIFSLALIVFVLGLFQTPKVSLGQPQYDDETLTIPSSFSMIEFADQFGTNESISSLNFTLPSSSWNVTDIELNFTSIKLGKEVKIVEDQFNTLEKVQEKKAWGVQINVTEEPTLLYGVYIFGYWFNDDGELPSDPAWVQISGYDPSNKPNATTYRSTLLDMGTEPLTVGWYYQDFSQPEPLVLNKSQYYLVINGTEMDKDETEYFWYLNDPSTIPNLHICNYEGTWQSAEIDKAFMYKMEQRVNRSYDPEDIKMAVEVDGTFYNITDGVNPNSGNVSITNLINFSPSSENLYIPIANNESIELFFNVSYHLKLQKSLLSLGTIKINEDSYNRWRINPSLERSNQNYSVKFETPNSWFNRTVFRYNGTDWENVTTELTIFNNIMFIPNSTIIEGALWLITANSLKESFYSTAIPTTTFLPSQTITIEVDPPPSPVNSNLTFILTTPFGQDVYTETIENPSAQETFLYTLPLNPFEGQWKAFIFWNNLTDAGLEILLLQVTTDSGGGGGGGRGSTVVTGIDPQLIFMVILYIAIASITGLSSYKMVKRHKKNKAAHREKVFNKYMDLLNLDYIMIIDKKSGLSVHDQILAGKERDSSLISGFLEAIRTFGIDLTGSEEESQTISLQYQNMNIIMNDFKNFRILNIMKESPSQDFLDSLRPLSHDIDTYYGKSLKDFDGNIAKFKGIKDLLETHLHTSLIYPLKVIKSKDIKLDSPEKALMNKAQSVMKKNKSDYFYVSQLMGMSKEFNVKNAEIILKLIEKKVFRPIE